MKSITEYLWFNTEKHREFINITDKVQKVLQKSRIKASSDLGAAGIGAAVCESARYGGLGAEVYLSEVLMINTKNG